MQQLQLVSWCLTSLYSTNIWLYQRQKVGWRAIPTQYSYILTSTLAAFLFSSHPKRERDREAHLNYYTSADNRERQLSEENLSIWILPELQRLWQWQTTMLLNTECFSCSPSVQFSTARCVFSTESAHLSCADGQQLKHSVLTSNVVCRCRNCCSSGSIHITW